MLHFLLPCSVFSSKTPLCASQGLRSLVRRQQRRRVVKALGLRSFVDNAEDHEDEPGNIQPSQKQGDHTRWLLTQGEQYRRPNENGPNWLGGSVVSIIGPSMPKPNRLYLFQPFPMNPSFKPPTPLSDKIRTQIFNLYMNENVNELELSSRFGLGVSRIKAILRLKKLEQLWIKVNIPILFSGAVMSTNRLVLKTFPWLKTLYMHGYLIFLRFSFISASLTNPEQVCVYHQNIPTQMKTVYNIHPLRLFHGRDS